MLPPLDSVPPSILGSVSVWLLEALSLSATGSWPRPVVDMLLAAWGATIGSTRRRSPSSGPTSSSLPGKASGVPGEEESKYVSEGLSRKGPVCICVGRRTERLGGDYRCNGQPVLVHKRFLAINRDRLRERR